MSIVRFYWFSSLEKDGFCFVCLIKMSLFSFARERKDDLAKILGKGNSPTEGLKDT